MPSMVNSLKLKSIQLKSFRGISSLEIELDSQLTVIAGRNGIGKTSILEAVLISSTHLFSHLSSGVRAFPFFKTQRDDRKLGEEFAEIGVTIGSPCLNDTYGVDFKLLPKPQLMPLSPKFHSLKRMLHSDGQSLENTRQQLDQLKEFPLIVYYSQDRISGLAVNRSVENRQSSLQTTLNSIPEFKEWFFEKEGDEGREVKERQDLGYSDPELDAVRSVLMQMEGFSGIKSRVPPGQKARVLYLRKNGQDIPIDELSSGERVYFVLAADLARRLMLEFPGKPVDECPALVCVDEVELHLHPAWQRSILPELCRMFSACQFVVTTHSPQAIGGVEAEKVRLLSSDDYGNVTVKVPNATMGRDSNFILEAHLGANERDPIAAQLFDDFDEQLHRGEFEKAENTLSRLSNLVEGGSSRVSVLKNKLARKRSAQQ